MIRRQCISTGLITALTLGCGSAVPPAGVVGHVSEYFGGVAADEPEAVLVARDVLSAGGSAVDAVVSMGLTMMVTRPDAAGPGGGGVCIAFDAKSGKGEAIEFLPQAPKSAAPAGRWAAASPGSFRGLFALHARYGSLPWEQLIIPAEQKARFGIRIPRVVTKVLASHGRAAIKDAQSRAIFFDGNNEPLKEGDVLRQVDLAATLGRIRTVGPGDFYTGVLARKFSDGVRRAGGWLPIEDLRTYRPKWITARSGTSGPHDVYFLPSPAIGGEIAADIWSAVGDIGLLSGVFTRSGEAERAAKSVTAARRAYAAAQVKPRYETVTTSAGALAIDRAGNSAACVFTMDRPFGSGRIAGETGIMPAEPARVGATLAMSAMIVANRNTKQSFLAATGAGDQFASSAMMEVVQRVLIGKADVEPALGAARIAAAAEAGGLLAEPNAPSAVRTAPGGNNLRVKEVPRIGQVNIMSCPKGVVALPDSCVVKTDPRGFGHAINAEF